MRGIRKLQVSDQVAQDDRGKDRQAADGKTNPAAAELLHQQVTVAVRAEEDCDLTQANSTLRESLDFPRDPRSFARVVRGPGEKHRAPFPLFSRQGRLTDLAGPRTTRAKLR